FADPNNPPHVTCTPSSGSLFALGTTAVNCSATDAFGTSTARFLCVVTDTTAPVVTVPSDITVDSTDGSPVAVTFTATAADPPTPSTPTVTPASPPTAALLTPAVNCPSTKNAHTSTASFTVTVVDTTPPVFTVTPDPPIMAEATGPGTTVVTYTVTATDLVDGDRPVTCTPPSGTAFQLDTTTVVQCTATDLHNNLGAANFTVSVVDTTPPTLHLPANFTVSTDAN